MKKIFVMILVTLLYFSSITLTNTDSTAKASIEEDYFLDAQYIYDITYNLSNIVYTSYEEDEIAKGRAFGSKGEQFAALKLAEEMEDLGLYDSSENISIPYREEIQHPYDDKLEILSKELKINGTENITDCFISPIWNNSVRFKNHPKNYDWNQLTGEFNFTNLKVYRQPNPDWLDIVLNNESFIESLLENESNMNLSTLLDRLIIQIEEKYGFKFEELNETNAPDIIPWWDDVYEPLCLSPYVLINETDAFNPNRTLALWEELIPPWSNTLWQMNYGKPIVEKIILNYTNCKAIIYYDFNDKTYNQYHNNYHPIPTININRTKGVPIYESCTEKTPSSIYTVDFLINQKWSENVTSYNVIGQINGTDPSKTIIVDSLYDSWWNQGTGDSAIGVGIVLAIAKYMKKLENDNIRPKYNVKFVLFGGEEYGYLGAESYAERHKDNENITAVIDVNQVGFTQNPPDPRVTLNIMANRFLVKHLTKEIGTQTDYINRTGNVTDFETWYKRLGAPSNDGAFAKISKCRTMCFMKDYGWNKLWRFIKHHRDGENHTQGDVIDLFNWADVNVTGEMIFNITKLFAYDPDCWFDGNPTFTLVDNTNDGVVNYDEINVSYTIKTIMPSDHVSVRLVLYPEFQWAHPCFPLLYRLRNEKEYVIDQDGISDYISLSLPEHYPKGKYRADLYICNSTGDVYLDTIHLLGVETCIDGLELLQYYRDGLFIDISEILFPVMTELYKSLGIDVIERIKRLPDLRDKRIRDVLIDILGFFSKSFNNESHFSEDLNMYPPNRPPEKPSTPTGETNVKTGQWYNYTTNAIDPDEGDKIRFQWNWTSNGIPGLWSTLKYDSGEDHTKSHKWDWPGEKEIRVRAKNPKSPNVFSNWSDPLSVNAEKSCYFDIITTHSYQNNINNPNIQNSFNPNMVVVGEDVLYHGYSYGLEGSPTYTYYFNGEHTRSSPDPIYSRSFDETGVKYVNLTVNTSNETVYYNTTVVVVNISACFNMSQLGAQPNQTIFFNDTSISNKNINSWFWSFGDGNTSNSQNTSHVFSNIGVYNVSLNVTDVDNNLASFWQNVCVETNPPEIIDVVHTPIPGTLGSNISLFAEVYDNSECGIDNVNVSISYPNGTICNFSMYESDDSMYDYEFVFNDTWQIGWYYYTVWVSDHANNTNNFTGCGFHIAPALGYTNMGNNPQNINDRITGSNFTALVNSTVDSVSVFIQTNDNPKVKCMIYNESTLIGTTEEKTLTTGDEPDWFTLNFTSTKPFLSTGFNYTLVCWSDDICNIYYDDDDGDFEHGKYKTQSYGTPPSSIIWIDEPRLYSIFCSYTTIPLIKNISVSPGVVGLGFDTTINAKVERYYVPVEEILLNITYPDNTTVSYSMTELDDDDFQFVFNDTWTMGVYNFTVWFLDTLGNNLSSNVSCFNVSTQASIAVCTEKDEYDGDDYVNLTDPPNNNDSSSVIGYRFLDNNSVLHVWNKFDDYYFNTSNGLQLTNHYNMYWSHNILMLGYYNNDQWNLIYRVDELGGFNKNIVSDNVSFVNVTLWKDLTYQGYNFRLAIRYYLGVDDNELMVIPYIKNLGVVIPYVLGFAWEIKDIQVDMTPSGDYLEINGTSYYLNQSLNQTYSNMSNPCFYIGEDFADSRSESLYLCWDGNLIYRVWVKSLSGQYNAPVTLGIKIGTLGVNQEKYTSLFWHDACEMVYYFDDYDDNDPGESWLTNPIYMVDGNESSFASTTLDGDVELLNGNSCSDEDLGVISKVELRCKGYYSGSGGMGAPKNITLRPVFSGGDGDDHVFTTGSSAGWSSWFDITFDSNASEKWEWKDVSDLFCDVESDIGSGYTLYCSKVEVRVTYSSDVVSDVFPVNGSSGICLVPTLSAYIDVGEEAVDISWLSNSSGDWEIFGSNDSVSSGTYYQVFDNATYNGVWWYWKVNLSFDNGFEESDVFSFYTGNESKIWNTGSYGFCGYLLLRVDYFNDTLDDWVLDQVVLYETFARSVNEGSYLALDSIFNNREVNTNSLSFGSGLYRVYAAFRDPDGDVLICDDDSLLEATYEFTVTFAE